MIRLDEKMRRNGLMSGILGIISSSSLESVVESEAWNEAFRIASKTPKCEAYYVESKDGKFMSTFYKDDREFFTDYSGQKICFYTYGGI